MTRRTTAGIAALLLGVILCGAAAAASPDKLDLNRATLAEVQDLPIPEELARSIVDYRTYVRYFSSLYDLMEVDGMTTSHLASLRPLVATLPPDPIDASIARLSASYRQVSRYLGQEGASEGLVDEYLDMLRDPVDINQLDLFDLQSFQNVSPVDSRNILAARDRLGKFENQRQLRRSDGLRYWSFRNLRDFVVYSEEEKGEGDKIHGNYQMRYYDTPYFADETETELNTPGAPSTSVGAPHMTHKLNLNLTGGFRAGVMTHRNMGEESWNDTKKAYYGVKDKDLGPFHLKNLYFGNYRVAFGQGLVMDNTDFYQSRRTGFGWNKRPIGVRGDLSRSREAALTGIGMEGRIGRVHTTLFTSWEKKDGIINPDGTINSYVTMNPRPTDDELDTINALGLNGEIRRDAFEENIIGGNVKVMLNEASYLGFTAYEARHDRAFHADPNVLIDRDDLLEARDSEVWAGYTSIETDEATGEVIEHKFRRVYGTEFQTVFDNVSFQGEYAVLQDPTTDWFRGKVKDAMVLNGFAQWENLHLLAIYRNQDVGFDNPYNRAFENDNRNEQTLLDSYYRLNNPYYSWLSSNTAQPKPGEGIFLQTRYRISRNLIINGLEFDQWKRQADGTDMTRYTIKMEYQPKFNLRFRMRHRFSSRSETNPNDVRWYRSWESRFEMITLLSNYNSLRFMFMTSNVWFPPRPRLSGHGDPADQGSYEGIPGVGTAAIPANAFQVKYEHHLSSGVRLMMSSEIYNGFLWNFEGNEFVVVDGRGFRNWFKVESRVSDQLLFQLKVTRDHNLPMTNLDIRRYGEAYGLEFESSYIPRDWTSYRLQMDYSF